MAPADEAVQELAEPVRVLVIGNSGLVDSSGTRRSVASMSRTLTTLTMPSTMSTMTHRNLQQGPAKSRVEKLLPEISAGYSELPHSLLQALKIGPYAEDTSTAGQLDVYDARALIVGHKVMCDLMSGQLDVDTVLLVIDSNDLLSDRRGAQTKHIAQFHLIAEQLELVATYGVPNMAVAMLGEWRESNLQHFLEVRDMVAYYLADAGYNAEKVPFVPVQEAISHESVEVAWNETSDLRDHVLRSVPAGAPEKRLLAAVQDVYLRNGSEVVATARVDMGTLRQGDHWFLAPGTQRLRVQTLEVDGHPVDAAQEGSVVSLVGCTMENEEEEEHERRMQETFVRHTQGKLVAEPRIAVGSVISLALKEPMKECRCLLAHITVLCDPSKSKFSEGYRARLDIHSAHVPCLIDKINWRRSRAGDHARCNKPSGLLAGDLAEVWIEPLEPVCAEVFRSCPAMGRIALRDNGVTVATGLVATVRRTGRLEAYFED